MKVYEDQLVVGARSPSESVAEPESAHAPADNDVPEVIDRRALPKRQGRSLSRLGNNRRLFQHRLVR